MTTWESLMKCQTIITFQDKYSNDELPWHYALTLISSRQWGVDISILCVEQGMERGRREHGREGGKSWGVEKLPCGWGHHERLNRWSSWTSHTMPQPHSHWLPDHQPPKRSKPLSRNPLPASHIGTHTLPRWLARRQCTLDTLTAHKKQCILQTLKLHAVVLLTMMHNDVHIYNLKLCCLLSMRSLTMDMGFQLPKWERERDCMYQKL